MGTWWCCMKADLRRRIAGGLLGALAAVLWLFALLNARELVRQYDGVSVRLEHASLTQRQLEQVAAQTEGESVSLRAAWSRGEKEQAISALGNKATLRRVSVYGDMRQVAPMRFLSGGIPADGDTNACLLDADSAMALFHSVDPIGATVTIGKQSYVVRGVVEVYEPMLVTRDSKAEFTNFEFTAQNLDEAKQAVETYLMTAGVMDGQIILLSGMLARVLQGALWLPPCLLVFVCGMRVLLRSRCRGETPKKRICFIILGLAAVSSAVIVASSSVYIPQAWLPTKWSDFGFWGRLVEGWRENFIAYSLMIQLPKDVVLFQSLRRGAHEALLTFLFGGWSLSLLWLQNGSRKTEKDEKTNHELQ